MDTHEEEGCRRLCSIEISAYYSRSDLQLFRRMHRLLEICLLCTLCRPTTCAARSNGTARHGEVHVQEEP